MINWIITLFLMLFSSCVVIYTNGYNDFLISFLIVFTLFYVVNAFFIKPTKKEIKIGSFSTISSVPRVEKILKKLAKKFNIQKSEVYIIENDEISCGIRCIGSTFCLFISRKFINNFSVNHLTAIFVHEIAHYLHKDALIIMLNYISIRLLLINFILCFYHTFISFFTANSSFSYINYFLLFVGYCLCILVASWLQRKMEFSADEFTIKNGFGNNFLAALNKLSDINSEQKDKIFLQKLISSHPEDSKRIINIKEKINEIDTKNS